MKESASYKTTEETSLEMSAVRMCVTLPALLFFSLHIGVKSMNTSQEKKKTLKTLTHTRRFLGVLATDGPSIILDARFSNGSLTSVRNLERTASAYKSRSFGPNAWLTASSSLNMAASNGKRPSTYMGLPVMYPFIL